MCCIRNLKLFNPATTSCLIPAPSIKTPEQSVNAGVVPASSATSAVQRTTSVDLNQTPVTSKPVPPPAEKCSTPRVTPAVPSAPSTPLGGPATPVTPCLARNSLKRLSSAQTPDSDSPFHVKTPDTPYGQVGLIRKICIQVPLKMA